MAISTNSNILIQGNTIDFGTDANALDGATYNNCIVLNLDPNATADLPAQNAEPGYAQITDNFLSGIVDTSPPIGAHIALVGGSTTITNNTFLGPGGPDGISITAYITVNSPNDQIITNNVFDSPTVDGPFGINEALVIGLTSTSTYHSNKNQTAYMPITKVPNLVSLYHHDIVVTAPTSFLTIPNVGGSPNPGSFDGLYNYSSDPSATSTAYFSSSYGYFSASETVMLPSNSPPFYPSAEGTYISGDPGGNVHVRIDYTSAMDVNQYLPVGVQILSFTVGLAADGYVQSSVTPSDPSLGSQYSLSASIKLPVNLTSISYSDATTAATAFLHGMADVRYALPLPPFSTPNSPVIASEATATLTVVGAAPGVGQTTSAQLNAATQYLFLDVSGLSYNTGTSNSISVIYQAQTLFGPTNPTPLTYVYESPLIVRYRW
jgi:hypothetical protein